MRNILILSILLSSYNGYGQHTTDTGTNSSIDIGKDNFIQVKRISTASENVKILDTAFHMTKLDRDRRIWIYLPPGYKAGIKRYPVLYMHDGQNVFDEASSDFGEWGVDEILDSLSVIKKSSAIVIGIDNGERRMNEYNPYFLEKAGEGEGDGYLDFVMKDLKPFIDKRYRTLPDKENTIIAGSSMGGLISYYAAIKYPSVFGRAGVFSPAFHTAPAIHLLTDSLAHRTGGMFFFYMGEPEGEEMMGEMNKVIAELGRSSSAFIYTVTDPDGMHNETAWRKWFAEFFLWVTSNGHSYIVR
jgi:predicted alpha/beta superfamily hydrolase